MNGTNIKRVSAREILDSRGNPTVEATVWLENGMFASAAVPSGASTGKYEAFELRDTDAARYRGKGVLSAVKNVGGEISDGLRGRSVFSQREIDTAMCEMDGTQEKRRLGANAILGVSLAVARAAAMARGVPLWEYVGGKECRRMPVPMMNVLNGGAHAGNGLDVQEFMILPIGAESFSEGLRMGCEIYHTLGEMLHASGYSVGVGDEGGFAPELKTAEEAMDFLVRAIEKAGYTTEQVRISLDVAASEWSEGDAYHLPKAGLRYKREEWARVLEGWVKNYPILSLEDPFGEDDIEGFTSFTAHVGDQCLIVGDDLFVTNETRLQMGIEKHAANAILIKPNQIGTLSQTLDVVKMAKAAGYFHIMSHRSGETEDTAIADLAVATGAPLIKTGAPSRSERVAKYNRLLRIEQDISDTEHYGFRYAVTGVRT